MHRYIDSKRDTYKPSPFDIIMLKDHLRGGPVEPPRYGIDWMKFWTWSLAITFGVACWVFVLIAALWWRG